MRILIAKTLDSSVIMEHNKNVPGWYDEIKKVSNDMGVYKAGDKVRVVRNGLDITGKTGVVTDAAIIKYNSDYVLVKLDYPDPKSVSQLGRVSLCEVWLTREETGDESH